MAPEKRSRGHAEAASEILEVDAAHSSLRRDNASTKRKKRRLLRSNTPEAAPENDPDQLLQPSQRAYDDYAQLRDAGFVDLEDEDGDTQRATQILQSRKRSILENSAAENGVIESMTCTNFMCHTKLHVTLGPMINFIIGHNGSGKSAVLTAITLCLGGKATSTNRGQSLKSFIKEGQESATLAIKLKNMEPAAYQHETYGDSIVVERHFTKSGTSGFRLKSAMGRVISTKKADLDDICDHFALQIDNPMNVLTQDMARQFLNNSSPAEKYKFFLKGVQLEQLDQDYALLMDCINSIEDKLNDRSEDVKALVEIAKKAQTKLTTLESQEGMRQKVRNYMRQMAWAQVEEEERILDKCEQDLRKAEDIIHLAQEKASAAETKYEEANVAHVEAVEFVNVTKERTLPLEDERKSLKEDFENNKVELLSIQNDQRAIRDTIRADDTRISRAKSDIEAEFRRLEDANGDNHTRRLTEIDDAKDQASEARDEYEQHEDELPGLEDARKTAVKREQEISEKLKSKREEVANCETQLKSLMNDSGEQQRAYPENMRLLLKAIDQETSFHKKPVGPIGYHIRLLKPVWSSILERNFSALLTSFIVTSKRDQKILSDLMARVRCSNPIYISSDEPIDTSNNEPDPQYDTILRVFQIDNEAVKRQLVINSGIEQNLLIEDLTQGSKVMFEVKPRNAKQCFCVDVNERGRGYRLAPTSEGGISQSSMPQLFGKPRMKTDIELQINFQRETLAQLKGQLRSMENEHAVRRRDITSCDQAIQRHRRRHQELHVAIQRADELVEQLQDQLEQENVGEGRLDTLKAELQDAESDKKMHEENYEDSVNSKDKLNETNSRLKAQLQAKDREIQAIESEIKEAERKCAVLSTNRQSALHEKNMRFQSIEDAIADKRRVEQDRQDQINVVNEFISQAREVCERVPVDPGETAKTIDKKLDKLTTDLERFTAQLGGTRESIAQEVNETRAAADLAKAQLDDMQELAYVLKQALTQRTDRWRKFRRYISSRARSQFTYLLSERSFRGTLTTDHRQHLLDLHVEPDETKSGEGRQTRTLSGGEKSFSTICLLLALWDAMGSPIRCLDEFDVFMDSVNRDVSMRMMISAARRAVGRQFILITPQSMGNVDVGDDVRIIKMSDPERGQTTLPFTTT